MFDILATGIDPTTATFVLAVLVLFSGVYLISKALKATDKDAAKQTFTAVGVLFGLLAAGGLGGLFATKVADDAASEAADQAAVQAGNQTANQISKDLQQLQNSIDAEGGAPKE